MTTTDLETIEAPRTFRPQFIGQATAIEQARAVAEAEVASLREQLAAFQSNARAVESELNTLNKERDQVRLRVEKMLQQMDELL